MNWYIGIHHWRAFRNSYRKLAWVGFEPHNYWILFRCSNWLSYQAMSSTCSQSQLCTATPISQFHVFVQCSCFISIFAIVSHHICFKQSLTQVITLVAEWIDTYGIHHWSIFRSSYRKLAWVGFEPTTTEFRSDALTDWAIRPWVQLALRANFVQLLQFHLFVQCSRFIFVFAIVSHHICFKQNLTQVITLVAEWIDTYGIHHWRVFGNSYRKLAWVGFEPHNYWILFRCSNRLSYRRRKSKLCYQCFLVFNTEFKTSWSW